MAEIIRINGSRQNVRPANGVAFTLEEMQAVVGGYIEFVGLNETDTMVLNEEGKLENLPFNIEATKVFRSYYPDSNDFIVGNVLICNNNQIR